MTDPATRRPGRPRSEATRQAILAAALELAGEHGTRGVGMDAIARRAGVSKETLYRWWRSKAEVILEAMAERGQAAIPEPDVGVLAGDLRAFLRATAAAVDPDTLRLLRALAAEAAADEGFAQLVSERFLARRRAALRGLLERAAERDELPHERIGTVVELVYGSLWYRLVFGAGPIDARWADAVASAVVGAAAGRGGPVSAG